jgi:phosphoglycerate dehydrogenase-like enzyme
VRLHPFLLPDGEIADGVRSLLSDVEFSTFDQALLAPDLTGVEFYVPPYLGGDSVLEVLGRLPDVRVVQALTAGVDWITPFVPPDVVLCNARGVHEASTSELAVAGILAMVKNIPQFVRLQERASWEHRRVGGLLGSRAVILGYGAIGQAVADRLRPFGVRVTGVTRSGRDGTRTLATIQEDLPSCDILVITAPLTSHTHGLVDAEMLARLPDGALVVNVARGQVVDNVALGHELLSGRLRAVLDVTDPEPLPASSELWRLPNVLVTPHVGGDSELFPRLASQLVVDQMRRYLTGAPLKHRIFS